MNTRDINGNSELIAAALGNIAKPCTGITKSDKLPDHLRPRFIAQFQLLSLTGQART
jgi:hypothetical protein